MPCAALLVLVILVKVAASVPLSRLSAWPVPLRVISLIVSVPKAAAGGEIPLAILAPVVLPILKPRKILLAPGPILTALVAAIAVVTAGNA